MGIDPTSGSGSYNWVKPKKPTESDDVSGADSRSVTNRQGTGGEIIPVQPVAAIGGGKPPDSHDPVFWTVDFSKLKDLKIDPGNEVEIPISRDKIKIKIKVSYIMNDANHYKLTLSLDSPLEGVRIFVKKQGKSDTSKESDVYLGKKEKSFITPIDKGQTIFIGGKPRIMLLLPEDKNGVRKLCIQESVDTVR